MRVIRFEYVATYGYFENMRSVGIKVLKDRLSEYVRLAADGETVLVTHRDRVVAELGPPQPGRARHLADAVLAEAVRSGWLRFLLAQGAPVQVASYDERLLEAARAVGIPVHSF